MIKVHPLGTWCWYYTKLGRAKAKILVEYVHIGGKQHKEELALIELKTKKNKIEQKTVPLEQIEII